MITQINIENPESELKIDLPIILREGDLIDLEFIIDKSIESYRKKTLQDYIDANGSIFVVKSSCLVMQLWEYEWSINIEK